MSERNKNSVITRARRIALCKITSGAINTLAPAAFIAIGDGGVDGEGEPVTPLDTQTELVNEIARYPVESAEYPVDTTARYTATIPEGELAGVKISEAGLIDADGVLCAVMTMYVKQKDDGVEFKFTFDDEF